jgi:hypothetical protein
VIDLCAETGAKIAVPGGVANNSVASRYWNLAVQTGMPEKNQKVTQSEDFWT